MVRVLPVDGVVPTKTRIKALLLHQGSLSPLFPRKAVLAIGIALTLCGVVMTVFGAVALVVEAVVSSLCSGAWIGVVVMCSGLTALLSGNRPHDSAVLHCNLFISVFVIASSGFLALVSLNVVVKGDVFPAPVATINLLLSVVACISGLLSTANFVLTIREACQWYSVPFSIGDGKDPLYHLRIDTLQRKERIVQWIMQQSTSVSQHPASTPVACVIPTPHKLRPLDSVASTSSTRLSAYDA